MSFTKLKRPPESTYYLDHGALEGPVTLPPNDFFVNEIVYWRKYVKQADSLDPLDEGVANHLIEDLRTITAGRDLVPAFARGGTTESHAEGRRWFAGALSRVALSRFWHEKSFLKPIEVDFGGPGQQPTICVDPPAEEFHKGGLHAARHLVENMGLAYPSRRRDLWHEGEHIFVRVSTPATPTEHYKAGYLEKITEPFPESQFASIVPFVKREIWERGITLPRD